jgi:hypothetical protein
MPRKQPTAAQRARQRQAATGQKYTAALRIGTRPTVQHAMFSADGAGWAPIIQRAERKLREIWPGRTAPHWSEKLGDLYRDVRWPQSHEVWAVLNQARQEASATCCQRSRNSPLRAVSASRNSPPSRSRFPMGTVTSGEGLGAPDRGLVVPVRVV